MSSTNLRAINAADIPYSSWRENEEQWKPIVEEHWRNITQRIEEEGEALGLAWIIYCGRGIVAQGYDMSTKPNQAEIEEWGRIINRIPFFYEITPREKPPAA